MEMRNMHRIDGRNPYGSRGGYVVSSRGRRRRGDRGMDYADMNYTGGRGGRPMRDYTYGQDTPTHDYRGYDMNDMPHYDGHYPQGHGSTYYPIQAMGTFEGYYGMPEQDYARSGRGRDYGYDMRGGYHNMDYGYDYGYGDYGETLSKKELEEWCHKLKQNLNEQEKQMFSKEMISQKAKQMGREMTNFGIEELEVVTLMLLDDYKKTLGANVDLMVKIAYDWLDDKDAKLKGAEKLAVYYDEIVMGE